MLAVSHRFRELRAESQKNITTEFGTQLRMDRSIQAEGAFGVLKGLWFHAKVSKTAQEFRFLS